MPKDRGNCDSSFRRSRVSPFPCSSSRARQSSSKDPLETNEVVIEWEEARCPVCMEHPHNAVLLLCSSHDKGCRPYMCDTSYRHSNCLDQFRKAFGEPIAGPAMQVSQVLSSDLNSTTSEERHSILHLEGEEPSPRSVPCDGQEPPKLSCPLCRGQINGWVVVDLARQFMDAKVRSCAQETCVFTGTYAELRKHARREHPLARPSEADPERQREWRRMERQRDLGDVLSTFQSAFGEESGEEDLLSLNEGGWLTFYFLIRVLPQSSASGSGWSVPSRFRGLTRSRRRTTLWGERYNGESGLSERESDDVLEGVSASWHPRERSQRSTTPDDEQL
ncbi:hypothetical protein AAC387_Pa03g3518 [Persea americana]